MKSSNLSEDRRDTAFRANSTAFIVGLCATMIAIGTQQTMLAVLLLVGSLSHLLAAFLGRPADEETRKGQDN